MSFSTLPWPIFALVFFSMGIYLIHNSFNTKQHPIVFRLGVFALGIVGVFAAVERIVNSLGILQLSHLLIDKVPIYITILAIPLVLAGCYQAAKDDSIKRKKVLILIWLFLALIIFVGLLTYLRFYA